MNIIRIILSLNLFTIIWSFTPEIVELDMRIIELQSISYKYSKNRSRLETTVSNSDQQAEFLLNYQLSSLNLQQICNFTGQNLSILSFQTNSQLYLLLNQPQHNRVLLTNSKCTSFSFFDHLQVSFVLTDRGASQTGSVFLITNNHQLVLINQDNGFQNYLKLTELHHKGQVVGGVARYRGTEKVQLFVAYRDGTLEVYDQSGSHKMKLFLEGSKSEIKLIADYHPYPILVTSSNWISMLDTSKYSQIPQNCPFIPDIHSIISQHDFDQVVYILSSNMIYGISFETGKKQCQIKRQFKLPFQLFQGKKLSFHNNAIFIDKKVYNMTQRKLYKQIQCEGDYEIDFLSKRGHSEKQLSLQTCCHQQKCKIEISTIIKEPQSKSVFIYLIISFAAILLISLSLMKKSNTSNLDLDDNYRERSRISYAEEKALEISRRNKEKFGKKKK